ncbi:MAG: T9SS type A sorting domain-containing protein [Candidatus Coatesbacteria bacterium]|nr:T9SS type A sorting domain-containing protein [Candidatus Coatesbacteria bacterium]
MLRSLIIILFLSSSLSMKTDLISLKGKDFLNSKARKKMIQHEGDYPFNVIHYDLNTKVNFDNSSHDGQITAKTLIEQNGLNQVVFDTFDSEIQEVTCNDTTCNFHLDEINGKLAMDLPHSYNQGDTINLSITFKCTPKEGMYFHKRNGSSIPNFVDTFGAPELNRHWYPCHDVPDDKVLVDLYIKVNSGYFAASNGVLKEIIQEDTLKTYHWEVSYPIANYLIAFVAGDLVELNDTYKGMPIKHYVFPEDSANARVSFQNTNNMLQCYEELFAPYPFPNEKFGFAEMLQFQGGMENQTLVFIHKAFINGRNNWDVQLLAHEVSHMWFGDAVTCGTFKDVWLNEGFASYCEPLYLFWDTNDTTAFRNYMKDFTRYIVNYSHAWDWAVYGWYSETYNYINYKKGAWVLHMLRHELGDSLFFKGMRDYYNKFLYTNAVTDEFKASMEATSGKNLTTFFDQWVYKPGYPTLVFEWHDFGSGTYVKIEQTQTQTHANAPVYDIPIELKFSNSEKDTLIVFRLNEISKVDTFSLGFTPLRMQIDPYEWLLETHQGKEFGFDNYAMTAKKIPDNLYISACPNPFKDRLKIALSCNNKGKEVELSVFSIDGRKLNEVFKGIIKGNHKAIDLNTSFLSTGIYILRLKSDKKTISKRILCLR